MWNAFFFFKFRIVQFLLFCTTNLPEFVILLSHESIEFVPLSVFYRNLMSRIVHRQDELPQCIVLDDLGPIYIFVLETKCNKSIEPSGNAWVEKEFEWNRVWGVRIRTIVVLVVFLLVLWWLIDPIGGCQCQRTNTIAIVRVLALWWRMPFFHIEWWPPSWVWNEQIYLRN